MALDNPTLIFILVSTSGLMASMFLVAFWRSPVAEARLCTAMLLTQMVTWGLYGARSQWPDQAWVIVFGNAALTLGWGFATDAACRFLHFRVPAYGHYWPVPLIALGSWLLINHAAARLLFFVLISCLQLGILMAIVLTHRRTPIGNLIAAAVVVLATAILGRSLDAWLHPDQSALAAGQAGLQSWVLVTCFVAIITLSFGFLMLLRDRVEREIRHLASHDGLTGALNRRAFIERADMELARCQRSKRPLALMMIDLDHFKQINDTHGHLVGDEVLRVVTRAIQSCLRRHDTLGRYGGEEFLVLAPEANQASAHALARRIRDVLRTSPFSVHGATFAAPTVSIGIALSSQESVPADLDTFISWADTALYQAKDNGRDRVVDTSLCELSD